MSWSKTLRRTAFIGLTLSLGPVLGACSFSPVYSGALANKPLLNLAYAKPNSRLEQIIYQELSFRFGSSESSTALLASVVVSASTAEMALSATANPSKPVEVTVTATLTIAHRDGSTVAPMTFTRKATANYTRSGQVLADIAAVNDTNERAAKAAAESLRLAVLAVLSRE